MTKHSYVFRAAHEEDTEKLGQSLALAIPAGTTVCMCGALGAGKTRLIQAISRGLGIADESVVSPTFTLCQEYRGKKNVYHFDTYRLKDEDEFLALGPEEMFESDAITFVEWGDRVRDCLPDEYLEISIRVLGEQEREFTITAMGDMDDGVILALAG